MLGRQNTDSNGTLIFLEDVSSRKALELKEAGEFRGKTGVPYFDVVKKVEGKWQSVGKEGSFTGNLTKLSVGLRYDPEKQAELIKKYKNSDQVTLEFRDPASDETYVWRLGFNIASKGLFNKLLNLTSGENLEVGYYKNNKGFDTFSLRQNDETVDWKHSLDELPKPVEVVFKGETQRDYTEVDKFFAAELKTFGETLKGFKSPVVTKESVVESEVDVPDGDAIPF